MAQTADELIALAKQYRKRFLRDANLTAAEQERFWADFAGQVRSVEWLVEIEDVVPDRGGQTGSDPWGASGDPYGYTVFGLVGKRGNWFSGRSRLTVQAMVSLEQRERVLRLKKGQRFSLRGRPQFDPHGDLRGSVHFVIRDAVVGSDQ